MIINDRLICDVCGRQIVSYDCNDKYCIGTIKEAIYLDINVHACRICKQDPLLRYQYGLDELNDILDF